VPRGNREPRPPALPWQFRGEPRRGSGAIASALSKRRQAIAFHRTRNSSFATAPSPIGWPFASTPLAFGSLPSADRQSDGRRLWTHSPDVSGLSPRLEHEQRVRADRGQESLPVLSLFGARYQVQALVTLLSARPSTRVMVILYLDYAALQSNGGPSVAAYTALRQARRRVDVVYTTEVKISASGADEQRLTPPVLVTPQGVITSVPEMIAWGVGRNDAALEAGTE
jgi:hypothetical protein